MKLRTAVATVLATSCAVLALATPPSAPSDPEACAFTGRWGYVPLTHLAGGGSHQRSSSLPFSAPSARCGGAPTYASA